MLRQRLVELAGNLTQLGQPRPRDRREVVVLVVKAHVVGEEVERAVVGECLWRGWSVRHRAPWRRRGLFENVLYFESGVSVGEEA